MLDYTGGIVFLQIHIKYILTSLCLLLLLLKLRKEGAHAIIIIVVTATTAAEVLCQTV